MKFLNKHKFKCSLTSLSSMNLIKEVLSTSIGLPFLSNSCSMKWKKLDLRKFGGGCLVNSSLPIWQLKKKIEKIHVLSHPKSILIYAQIPKIKLIYRVFRSQRWYSRWLRITENRNLHNKTRLLFYQNYRLVSYMKNRVF